MMLANGTRAALLLRYDSGASLEILPVLHIFSLEASNEDVASPPDDAALFAAEHSTDDFPDCILPSTMSIVITVLGMFRVRKNSNRALLSPNE